MLLHCIDPDIDDEDSFSESISASLTKAASSGLMMLEHSLKKMGSWLGVASDPDAVREQSSAP